MLKQSSVWSKSIGKLDKNNDKVYIINQVLMFGNLDEIKSLIKEYSEEEIKNVFTKNPIQIYSKSAFNLIKNYILKINENLDSGRYIKSVY